MSNDTLRDGEDTFPKITKIGDELPRYVITKSHGMVSEEAYALVQKILDELLEEIGSRHPALTICDETMIDCINRFAI
jgi:hypothetical protein